MQINSSYINNNYMQYRKTQQNINFKGQNKGYIEIDGTETKAKVYTDNIDKPTYNQIKTICSHPVFKDLPVRIMPDTHAGKTVPVGFTAPIGAQGEIIPSLISGDIGCGMLCTEIGTNGDDIDFKQLDKIIRDYLGKSHNRYPKSKKIREEKIGKLIAKYCEEELKVSYPKIMGSIGTLGGGNHFIEIDKSNDNKKYLVIHTGSRGFGQAVYSYHQHIAEQQNPYSIKELSYLTGDEAKKYLNEMKMAQQIAQINREIIADEIISQMGWTKNKSFESVHNYIADDNIIRKGSISSKNGEQAIIPLNMRDGSLLVTGKGNEDWNNSAPHGAGRILSRSEAGKKLNIEDYVNAMKGIYTSCISLKTLDEAPQVYKNANDIEKFITPTAKIDEVIKPIYNFKN